MFGQGSALYFGAKSRRGVFKDKSPYFNNWNNYNQKNKPLD